MPNAITTIGSNTAARIREVGLGAALVQPKGREEKPRKTQSSRAATDEQEYEIDGGGRQGHGKGRGMTTASKLGLDRRENK